MRYRLYSLYFFLGLVAAALVPAPLYSQAVGSIAGTVADPGQAMIPSATVTAVDKNTNFSRSTTTSSDGNYSLPRLAVGTYTVTASANGFEKSSVEVRLDVEQKREVNFTLAVLVSRRRLT
jgi:hypothetical protein